MKKDIHPTLHPVVFVDTSEGTEFVTTSTLTSDETKEINGVEHYVIKVELSSASHPFYTGKQKLVDTAGRVEKFKAKMEKAKQMSGSKGDDDDAAQDDNQGDDASTKDEEVVAEASKKEEVVEETTEATTEEEAPAEDESSDEETPEVEEASTDEPASEESEEEKAE